MLAFCSWPVHIWKGFGTAQQCSLLPVMIVLPQAGPWMLKAAQISWWSKKVCLHDKSQIDMKNHELLICNLHWETWWKHLTLNQLKVFIGLEQHTVHSSNCLARICCKNGCLGDNAGQSPDSLIEHCLIWQMTRRLVSGSIEWPCVSTLRFWTFTFWALCQLLVFTSWADQCQVSSIHALPRLLWQHSRSKTKVPKSPSLDACLLVVCCPFLWTWASHRSLYTKTPTRSSCSWTSTILAMPGGRKRSWAWASSLCLSKQLWRLTADKSKVCVNAARSWTNVQIQIVHIAQLQTSHSAKLCNAVSNLKAPTCVPSVWAASMWS